MRPWLRRGWAPLLAAGLAAAVVDEAGRYRPGTDFTSLAPPEPTEEDRKTSVDLSKQPVEKLFRLLAYELFREEKRPPERRFSIRDFQIATDLSCEERLLHLAQDAKQVSEEVRIYHLNVTGTAGLYWLLHKYPEEHSWVWLIATSHDRVLRKVGQHFSRLASLALDDGPGAACLSPGFRTVLMNAGATWKKIHGDHIALLWNGVAFGILGDVTSWREVDEESEVAEPGPGGPPPNVSWSENLIFGNMWISSVQKWLEHHANEVGQAAYTELARAQAGLPRDEHGQHWTQAAEGVLSSFEYLRQQLWGGWQLDKGLLRGFLRHCLEPGYGDSARVSVADFGAGGGQYSEWLNETGLVEAFAFDATQAVQEITGGAVQQADMAAEGLLLWRTFAWVLCLELGAQLPAGRAAALLRNARRHAEQGLVISWPAAGGPGALPEADFLALVQAETGFQLDRETTEALRRGCELEHLRETVAVFRAVA